jgi:DNA-binding CsgD family transcriptional regulator
MIKLPYRYIWQNPTLRTVMYPLRDQKLREFLLLYDEADTVAKYRQKLPAERAALVKPELQTLRERYEKMGHDELLDLILERFDADQARQRYPDWLRYAIVHFSGIRYKSAHGTWANPALLITKLENMLRETLKKASPQQVQEMAQKSGVQNLPADLEGQKTALFNHLTAQALVSPNLPPEAAPLAALERLLVMKERMGFPRWFWKEVVSHTDLRLAVQKGDWLNDWENLSLDDIRERQQSKDYRWQTILYEWKLDIAAWRQKHYSDLSLVVTRLVCNELSEHIHHLRGIKPAAGLTSKPVWYKNLMGAPTPPPKPDKPGLEKEKGKTQKPTPPPPIKDLPDSAFYFGRALNRTYFKPGASILSLGWTNRKPNPWQIANPIYGFDFEEQISPDWKYALVNNEYVRSRPAASPLGRAQKKHKDEKAGPKGKTAIPELREWLRWTHEAIVVGVFDLLDGPNVITFETYPKTGINRTHIMNKQNRWSEFIGVNPGKDFDPLKDAAKIQTFQAMLKRQNLQPASGLDEDMLSFDIPSPSGETPALDIHGEPGAAVQEISVIWTSLTGREKEVVALICQGFSTRDAATRLDTQTGTVQTHLSNAMEKFGVSSREVLIGLLSNWDFGELEEDSTQ